MSFSKAPVRRFNDSNTLTNNQKGKIQKSKSGFQKRALQTVRNLKNNRENPEQLTDLQPVEAEQSSPHKVQDESLIELEQKFEETPGKLSEVGQDAITNRDNLVTLLSKLKKKYNMVPNDVEILEKYLHEGDDLKVRWEEASKEESAFREEVLQVYAERLLKLEKENSQLVDLTKQLDVTSEELNTLRKLKNGLEAKLKQSNESIKVLEERLNGEEKKLKELLQQNNNIEKQLKLKEQHNDMKLQQTQQTLDAYNNKSQSQLQELEQRVNELKDVVQKKDALIEDLKHKLKTATDQLSLRSQTEQNSNSEESGKLLQAKQELDKKEEEIETLSQDVCNLKQLLKRSEEQASSLNAQLRKLFNSTPDQQVTMLRKQIGDVRMSMSAVVQRNAELESIITEKDFELEQKEKMLAEQKKVLKVRDELIALMKGKEKRQQEIISSLENALESTSEEESDVVIQNYDVM